MNASGPNPSVAVRNKRVSFGPSRRLLKHADFQRVYKQGRRHFAAHLTVFYLKRESVEEPRVGFAVGRVLGGAVVRNRIRRRLREAVRQNFAPGLAADLVVHPRKSALDADFSVLNTEIANAFQAIRGALDRAGTRIKGTQ